MRKVFCIAALLKSREHAAAILELLPLARRAGVEDTLREIESQDDTQLRSLWSDIRKNEAKDRKHELRHH